MELGCGAGRLLSDLAATRPDVSFHGVDVSDSLIDFAAATHCGDNLFFRSVDITNEAFAWTYDFVYSVDVLHHIKPLQPFAEAVRARLAVGRSWLAYEPNVFNPVVCYQQESMKRRGLGEDHFLPWRDAASIAAAGFRHGAKRYSLAFPTSFMPGPRLARAGLVAERVPVVGASLRMRFVAC